MLAKREKRQGSARRRAGDAADFAAAKPRKKPLKDLPADTEAIPAARTDGLTPNLQLTMQTVLVARRWRALVDERLRPMGQSAARMEAMATIAHSPASSAQIEIAKRIGIEGATLTRMLDSLERDGLVERRAHPFDRRTKHLRLTNHGAATLAEIIAVAAELRGHLLDGVGAAEIDQANAFLAALLIRLDQDIPKATPKTTGPGSGGQ